MAANKTRVTLGAGKWYATPWTSGAIDFETLCTETNLIGYTSGGATLTYTPETYTIEDDIGMVHRTFMTSGSATMSTGLLTFDVASLGALQSVGEVTTSGNITTLKLSGGRNALKKFSVAFVYTDPDTNATTSIGMIATNTAPLEMAFAKDSETIVNIEFTAETNGVDDTIVTIQDETASA